MPLGGSKPGAVPATPVSWGDDGSRIFPKTPIRHRTTRTRFHRPSGGRKNIDIRHLGPGSTFYLPVFLAPGALFYVGDPHMGMGDGEVALT